MELHLPVFPSLKSRSKLTEWMDDLEREDARLEEALYDIQTVNKQLGGAQIAVHGIKEFLKKNTICTIADLGCGLGDIPNAIYQSLKEQNPSVQIIGYDANPYIVQRARQTYGNQQGLHFEVADIMADAFKTAQFDVITLNLFLHHFTEAQSVQIIEQLRQQARVGIVINDLSRSIWAYWLFNLYAKIRGLRAMATYDGAVSVLRGFTKNELITILEKAHVKAYKITYHWAFRWRVIIYT